MFEAYGKTKPVKLNIVMWSHTYICSRRTRAKYILKKKDRNKRYERRVREVGEG